MPNQAKNSSTAVTSWIDDWITDGYYTTLNLSSFSFAHEWESKFKINRPCAKSSQTSNLTVLKNYIHSSVTSLPKIARRKK